MRFPWQRRKSEAGEQLSPEEVDRLLLMAREIAAYTERGAGAPVPPHLAFVMGPGADLTLQAVIARALVAVTGDEPAAAQAAIHLLDLVLTRAPAGHPDRGQWLLARFVASIDRHERTGDRTDLARAEDTAEEIVRAVPASTDILVPLGNAYWHQYEETRDGNDIERAVVHYERAFASAAGEGPRPDDWAELASLHLAHHNRFGRQENVQRAVECATLALAATAERDPDWGNHAVLLADAHIRRYSRSGVGADLDRAIELGERALSVLRRHEQGWSACAGLLGLAHLWRYRRTFERADLDLAIKLGELAVEADPGQLERLAHLAIAYQSRYESGGVDADAERAVELHRRTLAGVAGPERGTILSNLGLLYRRRYRRTGDLGDLDRAIDTGDRALAVTPEGHPATATAVGLVAIPHLWRYREFDQDVAPGTLDELVRRARGATSSPGDDRVLANFAVGTLALALEQHDIAVELLDDAVALLPSVAPRHGGQADHEHRFGERTGVVSAAVDAHCAVGDPEGAVRIAEVGRGVLLTGQLRLRTDPAELDDADPELAGRLRRVRDALAVEDNSLAGAERRRRLWTEHDELVNRIRGLPGFARFLATPAPEHLRQATAGGHVVLVNAGHKRGDAIIIGAGRDLVTVPLPDLTWQLATSRAAQVTELMHLAPTLATTLRRQREVPELLTWLWEVIVGPVLDALPAATDPPTRVWWLPTGVLGLFPLHAAGRPGEPGALDTVVSSYTANLRTLAHTRARPAPRARRQLLVAVPGTPGLPDLPGTAKDAAEVLTHRQKVVSLIDRDATSERVLAALPEATWTHFACHATADLATPSRGGLRLHDGVLPLPAIGALDLANAELAYLSACSTALGGALDLDESLHLASAFQLAGFRHVIAGLWPVADSTAAQAARSFYQHLSDADNADQAAAVLRRITLELRAHQPDRPDLWAPLIHYGV